MTADESKFTVAAEPDRRLVRIAMRGFWTEADIAAYDVELKRIGALMVVKGCPREEILALVDARKLSAQSQELVESYRRRFSAPERQPRRIATLVSSALFKRQVERVALPNQRIFEDEAEALEWLTK